MYEYYKLYYSVHILKCRLFFLYGFQYYKFKIVIVGYIIVIQIVRVMVERQGEQEKNCSKLRNLQQEINDVINAFVTVINCCQYENNDSFFTKLIVMIALSVTRKKCRQ